MQELTERRRRDAAERLQAPERAPRRGHLRRRKDGNLVYYAIVDEGVSRAVRGRLREPRAAARLAARRRSRSARVSALFELYQTEWCPASRRVRRAVTELGVDYVIRQVPVEQGSTRAAAPAPART